MADSVVPPASSVITVGKKRKRVVLSIQQKHEVLNRLADGEKPANIADFFGISRQQVSDIKKNEQRILKYCTGTVCLNQPASMLKRKTLKSTAAPDIEHELLRWFTTEYEEGRMVTSDILQEKALELFGQQLISEGADTSQISEDTFKATSSWMRNFKRRHGIKRLSTGDGYDGLTLPDDFKLGNLSAPGGSNNSGIITTHEANNMLQQHHRGNASAGGAGTSSADDGESVTTLRQLARRVNSLEQVMQQNIMHLEARLEEVVNLLQSRH